MELERSPTTIIANSGQFAENGYFRDQIFKQLSRQIRVLIPATCVNRARYKKLRRQKRNPDLTNFK